MFSKLKDWFRRIIAEEVAKVSSSLAKERADSIVALKNIEQDILRSLETEHAAFVERLRQSREHVFLGEPCRWQADAETIKADHALSRKK